MKLRNNKTDAGLALLALLSCILSVQLVADTTTPEKNGATPKQASSTANTHTRQPITSSTAKEKSQTTAKGRTRSAVAGSAQKGSAHHPATRRLSAKAQAAADRRRRSRLRPEPERVEEIQQALAQAGYLKGQPSGVWDEQTREAMRRFQADHGFPVTGLPEAKSLMKLGLGPHALPPDLDASSGANTSAPAGNETPATPNTPQDPLAPQP